MQIVLEKGFMNQKKIFMNDLKVRKVTFLYYHNDLVGDSTGKYLVLGTNLNLPLTSHCLRLITYTYACILYKSQ